MKAQNELMAQPVLQEVVSVSGTDPGGQAPANPLMQLHALLRGRYLWAVGLALLGMIAGGIAGYTAKEPTFRSSGLIRVRPSLPRILYQTEQSSVPPMFEASVAVQAELMQSRRVVEHALDQPEWKALGRPREHDDPVALRDGLEVNIPSPQLISVAFVDRDPKVAAAAVNAVIGSYMALYGDGNGDEGSTSSTMAVLEKRRDELTGELNQVLETIRQIADEFGSSALQSMYEFKLAELNKLESQLRQAQINLAAAQSADADLFSDPTDSLFSDELMLKGYLTERIELERRLQGTRSSFGPRHPEVIRLAASIEEIDRQVVEIRQRLRSRKESSPLTEATLPDGTPLPSTPRLRAAEAGLRALYEMVKRETVELGRKNLQIEKLRAEETNLRTALSETKGRIEQLTLESHVSGRVSVIGRGEVPVRAYKDKRVQLGAAGALAGGGAGVGIVLLLGLIDRRLKYASDAQKEFHHPGYLFGVLPAVPDDLSDPNQVMVAAQCVHRIRALLQIRRRATGHKVFSITSPTAGDGKTSLTVALGTSLAVSGSRTLLIDCDLEGAGLTVRLKKEASNGGSSIGLGDLLNGDALINGVHTTRVPNLDFIPRGNHRKDTRISPEALRRIIDEAKATYDSVLIDSGPVLGTVEAAIAAAESDGAILVVARGVNRALATEAMEYLRASGARIEGVIFNRASWVELTSSGYHSSIGRSRMVSRTEATDATDATPGVDRVMKKLASGPPHAQGE